MDQISSRCWQKSCSAIGWGLWPIAEKASRREINPTISSSISCSSSSFAFLLCSSDLRSLVLAKGSRAPSPPPLWWGRRLSTSPRSTDPAPVRAYHRLPWRSTLIAHRAISPPPPAFHPPILCSSSPPSPVPHRLWLRTSSPRSLRPLATASASRERAIRMPTSPCSQRSTIFWRGRLDGNASCTTSQCEC